MEKKKDPLNEAMGQYFRAMGARGGKIGGKNRWAGKTAEERSAAMRELAALKAAKKCQAGDKG